jgi:FkbM family methyltransferase
MIGMLSGLGQSVMDGLIKSRPGLLKERLERRFRRILCRLNDPIISIPAGGGKIKAHLSHNLPLYKKALRYYDTALRRFQDFCSGKEGAIAIIDIGANICDTAVYLLDGSDATVLCVEGGTEFLELLAINVAPYAGRVETADCYLGREEKTVVGKLSSHAGTARIELVAGGREMNVSTVESVIVQHPKFFSSRILKIDTDGYDCEIIRRALSWLVRSRAVIFVEFVPVLLEAVSKDYLETFELLRSIDYDFVMAYSNTGEYFCSGHLNDTGFMADLDFLTRQPHGPDFFDLFLFHEADAELGQSFRRSELKSHN